MKENKFSNLCRKKGITVIAWIFAAVMVAYLVFSVVVSVIVGVSEFFEWGLFVLGLMLLLGVGVFVILLSFANFARWRLTSKNGGASIPDMRLDRILSVLSAVFGMLALLFFVLSFPIADANIKAPWSEIAVNSQVNSFMLVSLLICVSALAVNGFSQLSLKFMKKKGGERKERTSVRGIRICGAVLLLLIFFGALFIPVTKTPYNDGGGVYERGSVGYKAVMYEVIVWDRTHTFGGEPLPEEEQQTRVYFFPFNCYTYDEKWEMKH